MADFRFLLLQIRNPGDPVRKHEVECFARAIGCDVDAILPHDLITSVPTAESLMAADAVLIGGSGDYSVVDGGDWFEDAVKLIQRLYEMGKPLFASCWGFQAIAKALGGVVVTDPKRAEVGTFELVMATDGAKDPVFSPLGTRFAVQLGHQDIVEQLPTSAMLLCSSRKVKNQAFTFPGKPIYATQFHPEFSKQDFIDRLNAYPEYVQKYTGLEFNKFVETCRETSAAQLILRRFVDSCLSIRKR